MNVEIKHSTDKHRKIISEITGRKNAALHKCRDRMEKWEAQEKLALGVIHLSELEKKKVREEKMSYVTVQVPYSYGMMMTAHTYFTSVFLSRDPVFQFQARHGETEQQEQAVEALLRYQYVVGGQAHPLFIWLYDACKYGIGIVGNYWEEDYAYSSEIVEIPAQYMGIPIPGAKPKKQRVTSKTLQFEGNKLYNVQPTKFIFDPSVTPAHLQDGEFTGRFYSLAHSKFMQGVAEGKYMNSDAAQQFFGMADPDSTTNSYLQTPDTYNYSETSNAGKGTAACLDLFVRLIPKAWGLGESEFPEIWLFTVIHGSVLIECHPISAYHCKFPFFTIEQEIEGYALHRPGVMEQLHPYNQILTWLFNSHFYNVEAGLNNQFVYDPSRVSMADILDPEPGKRIRLLPAAYGTDPKACVAQLATYDVTTSHLSDFDKVGQLMQRANGIADGVMGLQAPGGRKTATEARISTQGSTNRLKTVAEFMGHQGFTPLSQMMLANTQQYYSQDQLFRLTDDRNTIERAMRITPNEIAGQYDFIPVDGTMPIDRFAQAQLYQEMMMGLAQNPNLAMQFDFVSMATWIGKLFGMKGIDRFKIQAQAPEQIQQDLANGNAVPQGTQL